MTEKKELTPEEIATETLKLKTYLFAAGINHIEGNRDLFGNLAYHASRSKISEILSSPEAGKERQEVEVQEMDNARRLGINFQYPGATNYHVLTSMYATARTCFRNLSLGNLEAILKGEGVELGLEIPEEFRNLCASNVYDTIEKKKIVNEDDLEKKDKAVLRLTENLLEAYSTKGAEEITKEVDHFAPVKYKLKQIIEDYNSK